MGEPCLLSRGLVVAVVALWRAPRMITVVTVVTFRLLDQVVMVSKSEPSNIRRYDKKTRKTADPDRRAADARSRRQRAR